MTYILWKDSVNSDGQQFLQYQQNQQSPPLHLNSLNTKKTTIYDVGNPSPGLGQAQKCGGFKPVNGKPPLLDNWIHDVNTCINKQ